MSDPTATLIERILAIRRGELPEDAVTVEELRAAVAAQRAKFQQMPQQDSSSPKKVASKSKAAPVSFGKISF